MPVLDGYEATKRIKSAMRQSISPVDTKIVALTASAFEENRNQAFADGCDDFVRKPFRESDIFRKMTKHLGVRFLYKEQAHDRQVNGETDAPLPLPDLPSHIACLPSALKDKLAAATDSCNADEIDRIINEIQTLNSHLGDALMLLARKFAYQEIMGLIDTAKDHLQNTGA
jgi:CheY-like chemotaxis protein